jgi:hypothetical protein
MDRKDQVKLLRRISREKHKDMPRGRTLDKGKGYRRAEESRKKRQVILESLKG